MDSANRGPKPPQHSFIVSFLVKFGYLLLVLGLLTLLSVPLVYMLGSKPIHTHQLNPMDHVFETSPQHLKIYHQIQRISFPLNGTKKQKLAQLKSKNKYFVIRGSQDEGLFHFADYIANKQSLRQHNVIVYDLSSWIVTLFEVFEEIKYHLERVLDLQNKFKNIWIIKVAPGETVSKKLILKVVHRYPKDPVIIFISSQQKFPQTFVQYSYEVPSQNHIKQSIEQVFHIDQVKSNIVYDFYPTINEMFENLNLYLNGNNFQFSHELLLHDYYRQMEEFSQEDVRILRELCKKGQVNIGKQNLSESLTEFGLVSYKQHAFWADRHFMFNYELHKLVQCDKQGVASEEILFFIQQEKDDAMYPAKTEEQLLQESVWNEEELQALREQSELQHKKEVQEQKAKQQKQEKKNKKSKKGKKQKVKEKQERKQAQEQKKVKKEKKSDKKAKNKNKNKKISAE